MKIVEIENLVKRYGDLVALDHLNLSIEEGAVSYTHLDVYKRQLSRRWVELLQD